MEWIIIHSALAYLMGPHASVYSLRRRPTTTSARNLLHQEYDGSLGHRFFVVRVALPPSPARRVARRSRPAAVTPFNKSRCHRIDWRGRRREGRGRRTARHERVIFFSRRRRVVRPSSFNCFFHSLLPFLGLRLRPTLVCLKRGNGQRLVCAGPRRIETECCSMRLVLS